MLLAAGLALSLAVALPTGKSMVPMTFGDTTLEVYAYKPPTFKGERLIFVFHGTLRNADEYRDHAVAMADRFNAIVVCPKFDAERFPSIRYQRGGVVKPDGSAAKPDEWTYAYIPRIAEQIRKMERNPGLPYTCIGHSAGGQFVVRMAAFMNPGAERLVAANPGSALFPTREKPFGYGYGSLPAELSNDGVIKAYLARPLTIYLGLLDNAPDEYFDDSEEAMKQGGSRLERGVHVFKYARDLAQARGWDFNWRIEFAPGVEHDHEKMFNHPACERAMFGLGGLR